MAIDVYVIDELHRLPRPGSDLWSKIRGYFYQYEAEPQGSLEEIVEEVDEVVKKNPELEDNAARFLDGLRKYYKSKGLDEDEFVGFVIG